MKRVSFAFKILIFVAVLVLAGSIFFDQYSFIFSRVVTGKVVSVERVNAPMFLTTDASQPPPSTIFSFAVGIEDTKTGEIVVSSSEDRQWAAVEKGNCATVRFYPYPFWKLDKSGTYYNARLLHLLKTCDGPN